MAADRIVRGAMTGHVMPAGLRLLIRPAPSGRRLRRRQGTRGATRTPTKTVAKSRPVVICPAFIPRRRARKERNRIRTPRSPGFWRFDRSSKDRATNVPNVRWIVGKVDSLNNGGELTPG